MTFKYLELTRHEQTAVIRIDNPPVNALHPDVSDELYEAARLVADDKVYRSMIVTGTDKNFVAGGDLRFFTTLDPSSATDMAERAQGMQRLLSELRVPVIAAVNGYALGGGLELAMACDIIVADERAIFGLPEVTLGVIPGAGGTQMIVDLLPRGKARRLLFTGDRFSADEAESWGLVEVVAAPGTVVDAALEIADRINNAAPLAVEAAKRSAGQGIPRSLDQGHRREIELFAALFESTDVEEGLAAFLERRKPRFTRS